MKILIGYPDEAGRGKAVQLGGLEVSDAKKIEAFYNAKQQHRYPEGIKRIEMLETIPQETAIFVGEKAAVEAEAFAAKAQNPKSKGKGK